MWNCGLAIEFLDAQTSFSFKMVKYGLVLNEVMSFSFGCRSFCGLESYYIFLVKRLYTLFRTAILPDYDKYLTRTTFVCRWHSTVQQSTASVSTAISGRYKLWCVMEDQSVCLVMMSVVEDVSVVVTTQLHLLLSFASSSSAMLVSFARVRR